MRLFALHFLFGVFFIRALQEILLPACHPVNGVYWYCALYQCSLSDVPLYTHSTHSMANYTMAEGNGLRDTAEITL